MQELEDVTEGMALFITVLATTVRSLNQSPRSANPSSFFISRLHQLLDEAEANQSVFGVSATGLTDARRLCTSLQQALESPNRT